MGETAVSHDQMGKTAVSQQSTMTNRGKQQSISSQHDQQGKTAVNQQSTMTNRGKQFSLSLPLLSDDGISRATPYSVSDLLISRLAHSDAVATMTTGDVTRSSDQHTECRPTVGGKRSSRSHHNYNTVLPLVRK